MPMTCAFFTDLRSIDFIEFVPGLSWRLHARASNHGLPRSGRASMTTCRRCQGHPLARFARPLYANSRHAIAGADPLPKNGVCRSREQPAHFTNQARSFTYLFMLSFISCAALLSSGSNCDGPSLKSTLLIVPVKGNGTW